MNNNHFNDIIGTVKRKAYACDLCHVPESVKNSLGDK